MTAEIDDMPVQNESSPNKKYYYGIEIAFAIVTFIYVCPLIPFTVTLIHPRFILYYLALLPLVGVIPAAFLFIISATRLLVGLRRNPKASLIRGIFLALTLVLGFLLWHCIPWWDAAAQGIYLNLKSEDFSELRTWAKSVELPKGESHLHIRFGDPIPPAPAKFKPLAVWVEELENKKDRVVEISWCGGLFGHVHLLVGSTDMPIPKPNQYIHAQKRVSPGAYIVISE